MTDSSPLSMFLKDLLADKAAASPAIVQDNAHQLKRKRKVPLRMRSCSHIDPRESRWTRTDSDSSLVQPTRSLPRHPSRSSTKASIPKRAESDIDMYLLASKAKRNTFKPSLASLASPSATKQNAGWDHFNFQANKSKQSNIFSKNQLLCPIMDADVDCTPTRPCRPSLTSPNVSSSSPQCPRRKPDYPYEFSPSSVLDFPIHTPTSADKKGRHDRWTGGNTQNVKKGLSRPDSSSRLVSAVAMVVV
eukprot:Nitzschia sp. Nitz4//scaffold27_size158506//138622//139362//NITZ4_002623-RA/size158506-processed-gene-0.91-mRNA-1//-1//CDS//3329545557//5671//frame0